MADLTEKQLAHNRRCMPKIVAALGEGRPWMFSSLTTEGDEEKEEEINQMRGNITKEQMVNMLASIIDQDRVFARTVIEALAAVCFHHMKEVIDKLEAEGFDPKDHFKSPEAPGTGSEN